MLHNRSNMT